ncbi:hypothetical protein [Adhaeribacter terreus]|uniref:DUF4760 domain-containing protein n=1 Tax=Adhaeribacter terreus TaxID=529703 RepID=A0ABW0EGP5_9BACT
MELLKTLGPSIITLVGIVIGWYLKEQSEKLRLQKEKLLETKRENYLKVLIPIIRIFAGIRNKNEMEKAIKEVQSFDYKQTAFHLMMFGSDGVVRAYNDFFQFLYNQPDTSSPKLMMTYLGRLVIEIRKDIGNNSTTLKELDMLRFMITDIDKFN